MGLDGIAFFDSFCLSRDPAEFLDKGWGRCRGRGRAWEVARGEAVAPAGPRARPREGSPAPADFSQEDQRGKGAKANPIPRDGLRVALGDGPAGQAGELSRRRGSDRRAIVLSTVWLIGSGYQTGEPNR
jgi:hypothetical protein